MKSLIPICVFALAGSAASGATDERSGTLASAPPAAVERTYSTASGASHIYLVQEPKTADADAPVLIYMHGMGGKEEQGMELFPSLRPHLDELGWIYVCPRDNECAGLLDDLEKHYGARRIYLSGASSGGRWALWEAARHPDRYSGLILMCPALRQTRLARNLGDDPLSMPVWIVCGENDTAYAASSRWLTRTLKERERKVHYREIPGGGHNAPCTLIDWPRALSFLERNAEGPRQDLRKEGPG